MTHSGSRHGHEAFVLESPTKHLGQKQYLGQELNRLLWIIPDLDRFVKSKPTGSQYDIKVGITIML